MKNNRFTLVELMVVGAVVFIVAGIVLGTYSRARESASKVLCANNLRQLTVGYTFYAKASDDEYPPFAWIMNPNGKLGDNDDMIFAGHPPQGKGSGLTSKLHGGAWLDDSMAPVMLCPSDEDPEIRIYSSQINHSFTLNDFSYTTSYNQTKKMGNGLVEVESSYGYNLNLGLYEVLMLGMDDPAGMLVNFDADSLLGEALKQNGASKPDLNDIKNIVDNVFALRHLNEANMLYADGHVRQGTMNDVTDDNLMSFKWRTTGNGYFDTTTTGKPGKPGKKK